MIIRAESTKEYRKIPNTSHFNKVTGYKINDEQLTSPLYGETEIKSTIYGLVRWLSG